jgi:enterochelin esterase-like enzyme
MPSPAVEKTQLSATATLSPSPTPSPTELACWSQPGTLEQFSLSDGRLRLPMEYSVYLPPCYDQQPERRYPVLYLIHGQNYNNDQWDRLGADEAASRLIASGEAPPFLIVMPRDRLWEQPEVDPFGEVVVEKLIPLIDRDYRSLPERRYRAVGGLSRGAGWAVHLGLSHWELFGAIGGHSLPVFWSDTARVRGWLDAIPQQALPRIYLDIGEKDRPSILESARWFEGVLTEKSIPHEWYLFPGYHEEAYWSAHVEGYLRWYAADW